MTLEDFLNHCLRIKNHDTRLSIPCCANCKYYKTNRDVEGYRCFHPRLMTNGNMAWLTLQPEDFCSRWEDRHAG
ncbi:MAG: hypothetical protein IJ880_17490 [Bacilli bacterium]|nr:hypothetical protein [Bacilli bacterium]